MRIIKAMLLMLFCMGIYSPVYCLASALVSSLKGELRADHDQAIPLCEEALNPDEAPEKVFIHCGLEYGSFVPPAAEVNSGGKKILRVVEYNIERGMRIDKQIQLLSKHPDFKDADVILISEADRGCSRTQYRNIARDIASALGMNYVYGVEYIELPRIASKPVNEISAVCEHGNAVLSKYPITGAEEIRHKHTVNSYIPPGSGRDNMEPRLGGVMAVAADIDAGGSPLRVYSLHFDTAHFSSRENQEIQAREITEHAAEVDYPVIAGGDLNTVSYISDLRNGTKADLATAHFLESGYVDAHMANPLGKRYTSGMEYGVKVIIDIVFLRGARSVESGVCPQPVCGKLSDHLPVWGVVELE